MTLAVMLKKSNPVPALTTPLGLPLSLNRTLLNQNDGFEDQAWASSVLTHPVLCRALT